MTSISNDYFEDPAYYEETDVIISRRKKEQMEEDAEIAYDRIREEQLN